MICQTIPINFLRETNVFMITRIDSQTLDFLAKKKLTFNQFCMCLLVFHQDVAGILKYTNEIGYITGGTVLRADRKEVNELEDLINRGYIKHTFLDKSDYYSLDNFSVTEKFAKGFLDRFEEYAKELWALYPKEGMINNNTFTAKSVDYDEYKDKYTSILKEDIEIHKINIDRLRAYLKTHKYAEMGIMKYIGSRHWENLTDIANERKIRLH